MRQAFNPQTGKPLKNYVISPKGVCKKVGKDPLKPQGTKYLFYRISIDGKAKNFLIHRIVACTYLGFSKLQINHKDGNTKNNNVKNLEFVTPLENTRHALYTLKKAKRFKLGLKDYLHAKKLKDSGHSLRLIAKKLGVKCHTSVMDLLNNPGHRVRLESVKKTRNKISRKVNKRIRTNTKFFLGVNSTESDTRVTG